MCRSNSIAARLTALITLVVLAGCSGRSSSTEEFQLQGFSGRYGIDRIESAKTEGKSLVFGWIHFDVPAIGDTVNISCVALAIDEYRSEKIYIDSVAHVIPTNLEVVEGRSKFQVYWLFGGNISQDEIEHATMKLESLSECDLDAT